ncbi:hypothetical protein [Kangiella marina]|uniref:Uncharacterized protein n=1 Tax=Kangiella marina TaxID=1079178 RepID=A0ABP8IKM2_9GAMM
MFFTKKSFSKFPWKLLIFESLLVILSVLLALALNSWREAQAHQELAERALQEVVDEVEANCLRIISFQSYHEAVAAGDEKPSGIQVGYLRNDAWEIAKTTQASSYLDYEILSLIGEINANQSDHRAIVQAYIEALFIRSLRIETVEELHQEGERAVIRELYRIQSKLLTNYQRLQQTINKHHRDSVITDNICLKK